MDRAFAVVADRLHTCFASLSRYTPLKIAHTPKGVIEGVFHDVLGIAQLVTPEYCRPLDLPERVYGIREVSSPISEEEFRRRSERQIVDAMYRRADYFNARKADTRCRSHVRTVAGGFIESMQSLDILNHGTGSLRPIHPHRSTFEILLGTPGCSLMPKGTQRLGRAIARTQPDDGARNFFPEPWESTNIILGDEFGEIQQLYDRRDDTSFLEGLCRALPLEYCGYGSPSGEWKQVHEWHLRTQAIWKNPPATPAELLDRVEYVLSHTTLDSNPGMKVELHEPAWNTV